MHKQINQINILHQSENNTFLTDLEGYYIPYSTINHKKEAKATKYFDSFLSYDEQQWYGVLVH